MHKLKINAVPYYESIIKGYLKMQKELNKLQIAEKGIMTFGTDAAWIYLLDMAVAQCENLKDLKDVDEFRKKYSEIYDEKNNRLSEKQLKELELMKNQRLFFECKYWARGIIKNLSKRFFNLPGAYRIVERLKYKKG